MFVGCIAYADDIILLSASVVQLHTMKYLGVNFISSKQLKIDICPFLRKFNTSVNAIMARSKCVNEDVKLRLF